jgi:hypothetical protein
MNRKWGVVRVGLATIFLMALAAPAYAWEFSMKGSFNWYHEWYSQMGSNGFFGQYNIDNGNNTRVANLNFWNGGQFDTSFVSGSNAGWSYFNVEFEPEIKINSAIKIRGLYRLGTFGDPAASDYHTQDAPGIKNAFSEGQWSLFWITANSPWGVFAVGKRPWSFGTALQYDGSDATSTESLSLVTPFGPFDVGIAYYPYRYAGDSSIYVIAGRQGVQAAYGDPYNLPKYPEFDVHPNPTQIIRTHDSGYYSSADRSGSFSKDFLGFVTYSNGPVKTGIIAAFGSYHIGPEASLNNAIRGLDGQDPTFAIDSEFNHGSIYLQYNDGRFFANSEAAWLYWTDRYQGVQAARQEYRHGINPPYTRYIEQWRCALELGLLAGPVKLSGIVGWSPGPDRRNGLYVDKQQSAFTWHPSFESHFLSNYSLFSPYSHIFVYDYGSGLNAYNLSGDGFLRDAFLLAARMDYAVAANLNIFGTFFWAQRTSDGYPWGVLRPSLSRLPDFYNNLYLTDGSVDFGGVTPGPLNYSAYSYGVSPAQVPNITKRDLGFEVNAGFNWKLLEGWTLGALVGYWAPGDWFKYACVDRSVLNWNLNNLSGTRADRKIDPVMGGEVTMVFEF